MSQRRDDADHNRRNMAVSYSSGFPAEPNQTLPSFRELLPPHLHEEIDSASYYSQSRQQQIERTAASEQDPLLKPRSLSGQPVRGQSRSTLPPPSGSSTPGGTFPSRGPSPILPPLRELQSLSGRHLDRPMSTYDDTASVRSGGFEATEASTPFGSRSSDGERYVPPPFGSGPPVMYNQGGYDNPRYVHYAGSYPSESEYSSMMHNPPASNFGMMGDPLDSRGKRRRGNLPKPVTDILRAWFHEHLDHPYPSEEDKQIFMARTNLSISQISNWFINARRRQLPALRNQIRNGDGDPNARPSSPMSDVEPTSSPASTSSPIRSHNHP